MRDPLHTIGRPRLSPRERAGFVAGLVVGALLLTLDLCILAYGLTLF